jgi:hypothetical protein
MSRRRERDYSPEWDAFGDPADGAVRTGAVPIPPRMTPLVTMSGNEVERIKRLIPTSLGLIEKVLNIDCEYTVVDGAVFCMEHGSDCPSWTVRLKAAFGLLDRAGLGPHSTIHSGEKESKLRDLPMADIAAQLEAMAGAAKRLSEKNVIEVDVVREDREPEARANDTHIMNVERKDRVNPA